MTDEIIIEIESGHEKESTIAVLRKLGELETASALLYRTYAGVWRKDKDFWGGLAVTEERHRTYLDDLIRMVDANPGRFTLRQRFSITMVNEVIKKIHHHISLTRSGHLEAQQALYHAHHLENLAVESELACLFQSDDPEFLRLSGEILADEKDHQGTIKRLLKERCPRRTLNGKKPRGATP